MKIRKPGKLKQALGLLAEAASSGEALTPIAGGTDLMVCWHDQVKKDWALLDLSGLDELRRIRLTDEFVELGGLTTYWDVIRYGEVAAAFPLLAEAARQIGAIQIQTRGTWAGNVANASPAADGVLVMMAYDAVVVLQSESQQREVALDQYYTGYKQTVRRPDELIVALRMPRRTRDVDWFEKVGARCAQAISKVGVAVVHDENGWRIVANSVAPYVCRCARLEQALERGEVFSSPDDIRRILRDDIAPIDDIRSTAAYRETVLSRMLYFGLSQRRAVAGP